MELRTEEALEARILILRGQRVILDADLAALYGVETRRLNQAVRRNGGKFPEEFSFSLTDQEVANLRSQSVISSLGHGGRRFCVLAFTELASPAGPEHGRKIGFHEGNR
jgi:hypothetical protein